MDKTKRLKNLLLLAVKIAVSGVIFLHIEKIWIA